MNSLNAVWVSEPCGRRGVDGVGGGAGQGGCDCGGDAMILVVLAGWFVGWLRYNWQWPLDGGGGGCGGWLVSWWLGGCCGSGSGGTKQWVLVGGSDGGELLAFNGNLELGIAEEKRKYYEQLKKNW